jgi:DNA-binding transcriptional regulator GbsR (MarR family)
MNSDNILQDTPKFDPEIRAIEKEIVKFFATKASEFTGRHPITSKVMTYFYIRKMLTQRDLQILTGFSAGTISKAVRQLLKMNIITKETIPNTHKHIYKMEKLPFISPRYFLMTESVMDDRIEELEEMKKTLDDHREEMKTFETYHKSYEIVTQLLRLLPTISIFLENIEEELEERKTNLT